MKRTNILLLTSLLLIQTASVWGMMPNEDIERSSANYRPGISSIRTESDPIAQVPAMQSTGSLIVQGGDIIVGTPDDENSICAIISSSMASGGDLTLTASNIYLSASKIKSTGSLSLSASGSITINGNTSLDSKECISIKYNK